MADAVVMLSYDLQFAFVARTARTCSAPAALGALAARADDVFAGYPVGGFDARTAQVIGLEHWDTDAGVRHERPAAVTQALWRVDISALALTHPESLTGPSVFASALQPMRHAGNVDEETWGRLSVLQDRVDALDDELRARQSARPADGPRAYATTEHACALVRLVALATETLAASQQAAGAPAALGEDLAAHSAVVRERLDAEDDLEVAALRRELDQL